MSFLQEKKSLVIGLIFIIIIAFICIIGFVILNNRETAADNQNSATNINNIRNQSAAGENGFPSLHITSYLNPFVQERNFWHDGTVMLEGTEFGFEDIDVRLRGRGNSTWFAGPGKRPLRLRFNGGQSMFGSEEHRDWVLIANHFDISLMRNHGAFYLSSLLSGLDFTPSSQFLHLYVNGEYMGVYQLTDERDINPGRIQLAFDPNPAVSEYLFELDGHLIGWRADEFVEGEDFFIVNGKSYDIRFPSDNLWDGHLEYLHAFVQNVSDTLLTHDYEAIKSLIDIDSAIDFYIVQELFKNVDVGNFSVFMSLRGQGENRRIYFGPVWDFDRSAGNDLTNPQPEGLLAGTDNYWFYQLLATPEIRARVVNRWNEVVFAEIRQMINHLQHLASFYRADFERNFDRHIIADMFMVDRSNPITLNLATFYEHFQYLITWLNHRVDWLDAYFNNQPLPDSGLFTYYDAFTARLYYLVYHGRQVSIVIDGELQNINYSSFIMNDWVMLERRDMISLFGVDLPLQEPVLFNEYTFMPLRLLENHIAYNIDWDGSTHSVMLTSN